jgi:hypothetical protein
MNVGWNVETLFVFGGITSAIALIKEIISNRIEITPSSTVQPPKVEFFSERNQLENLKELEVKLNKEIQHQEIAIKLIYHSLLRLNSVKSLNEFTSCLDLVG